MDANTKEAMIHHPLACSCMGTHRSREAKCDDTTNEITRLHFEVAGILYRVQLCTKHVGSTVVVDAVELGFVCRESTSTRHWYRNNCMEY